MLTKAEKLRAIFERDGRVWLRQAVSADALAQLCWLSQPDGKPGTRHASDRPLAREVRTGAVNSAIRSVWPEVEPVRVVSFDKKAGTNWSLPWHQDRTIAVREKAQAKGYDNWSQKDGTWHCEPPKSILERMTFARVHLDPTTPDNGPMQIAMGSHVRGVISAKDADEIATEYPIDSSFAAAGDILVVSMLTLHRSLPSKSDQPRRTLRIDFSPDQLPAPLRWAL